MHAWDHWRAFRWQLRSLGPYYWMRCAIVNIYLDVIDARQRRRRRKLGLSEG